MCRSSDRTASFFRSYAGRRLNRSGPRYFLGVNKEEAAARSRADLEPDIELYDPDDPHEESSHFEKLFWSPVSVKLDDEGRLYVTESNRHRIQIYQRAS